MIKLNYQNVSIKRIFHVKSLNLFKEHKELRHKWLHREYTNNKFWICSSWLIILLKVLLIIKNSDFSLILIIFAFRIIYPFLKYPY